MNNKPWHNNIDRLSEMMVVGTYLYSILWFIKGDFTFNWMFATCLGLFAISTIARIKFGFYVNKSERFFFLHTVLDIFLATAIAYSTQNYSTIPILFSLTAIGTSATEKRHAIAISVVATVGIVLLNQHNMQTTHIGEILGASFSTIFNLYIIIGYARIISDLFSQRRQLQRQQNQLKEKHEELEQAYDALYMNMVEQEALAVQKERNRMSGELHDHMGHAMATSLIQIQYVQKVMFKDLEKASEKLEQVHQHLNHSYEEIRSFVRTNQKVELQGAGPEKLLRRLEEMQQHTQLILKVDMRSANQVWQMSMESETHLLRIIQESITNSMKHGNATCLNICVEDAHFQGQSNLKLTLLDDGDGNSSIEAGYGLSSMKNRAQQLGGQIAFESEPQVGFKTTLQIPIRMEHQECAV